MHRRKATSVTKTPEVPVLENPEPQDLTYPPAESSAFAGAALEVSIFFGTAGVITCGASNIRVEAHQ